MTRVVVIPADRGGCGFYRLIWPAQAVSLVRRDWEVEVRAPDHVQVGTRDGKLIGIRGIDPATTDLVVMQRVGTPAQMTVLQWAHEQGIATLVDFDDAMWCIDKGNQAWSSWNMGNVHGQDWRICDRASEVADLVTTTTDALARRYAKHGRTEVVPNRVPQEAVNLPPAERPEGEPVTAGWAGYTKTHPGDCTVSAPAARAVLEAGGQLRVVADAKGAARDWGVDPDRVASIPPQKFGPGYFSSLSLMDLMLVGLRDTPFNQAKSTLKVLEAAAAGVPSIAPANRPHRALAKDFPLILADSPSDWAQEAKRLATDVDALSEMTTAVKKAVKGQTIEGNAEQWAQAWERAMARGRR